MPLSWVQAAVVALMLLLLRPPATLTMFAGAHERTSKSPPAMGWRSWYALGPKPTQAGMEAAAAAMVNRSHRDPVTGRPTSLLDLGYSRVALDGGWPLLGGGINGSYHDARGWPVINTTAFPDIKGMVADAHAKGLTAGFYTNNYEDVRSEAGWSKTPELRALHMKGEADFLAAMLYDEVKVDSGGEFNDMDWWARELNATGRAIAVENCHQGHIIPNASWCPFQMWRTSGDPAAIGWQYEMADTAPLLFLSRPGCWAYPGYTLFKQSMQDQYTNDSRSQFGVHCVTSSPLILSFDITAASPRLDNHWSVLSNREAIEVNQRWAGSAGALIRQWNPYAANTSAQLFLWAEACNSTAAAITGWQVNTGDGAVRVTVAADGKRDTVDNDGISVSPRVAPLCLQRDGSNVGVRECNSTDPNQAFTFDDSTGGIRIPAQASDISESGTDCIQIQAASSFQMGPAVGFADCNAGGSTRTRGGRQFALLTGGNAAGGHMVADNGTGVCLVARRARPNSFGPMQLWSKPLGNGSAAVFVLAMADGVWSNSNPDAQVAIVALAEIPGLDTSRGSVKVRDIWNGADLPSISGGDKSQLVTDAIAPGDSRFFLLSPGTTPAMAA